MTATPPEDAPFHCQECGCPRYGRCADPTAPTCPCPACATAAADVPSADFPLERWEVDTLATFNAEVARGLVHTDKWRTRMGWLQARFDSVGYVNRRGKQVHP